MSSFRCPNCDRNLSVTLVGPDSGHTGSGPFESLGEYQRDGTIKLSRTGHVVPAPIPGEGITYYYERIGGNPGLSGALLMNSEPYRISRSGDPVMDLAVLVDAFSNPEAYGLGSAGAPGVAAGPVAPVDPVTPGDPPHAGDPLYVGTIPTGGVNSEWRASNPGQVQYADISADGTYSVVCDGVVPVYVGVGFAPGIATYDDLVAGGVIGTQVAEVYVKAGQYLCFVHEGNPGNRMRASQR